MQYDTLALLAAIPTMREMYFTPLVMPPLQDQPPPLAGKRTRHPRLDNEAEAYAKGTRNLIGTSPEEHNLKDPGLLVDLLKTGYREGLMCHQEKCTRRHSLSGHASHDQLTKKPSLFKEASKRDSFLMQSDEKACQDEKKDELDSLRAREAVTPQCQEAVS